MLYYLRDRCPCRGEASQAQRLLRLSACDKPFQQGYVPKPALGMACSNWAVVGNLIFFFSLTAFSWFPITPKNNSMQNEAAAFLPSLDKC